MKQVVIIGLIIGALTTFLKAHSGGTNSQGCHLDHKTGIYHCH